MTRRAAYGVLLPAACVVVLAAAGTPAGASPTPVAAESVDLGGTPVEVSNSPADPTVLTAGLWADTLTGPGTAPANAHWFRYDRTMQFGSVLVGAVATSPYETSDLVDLDVTAPDGTDCGTDSSSAGSQAPGSAYGALVAVPDDSLGDRSDPCVEADHLLIRLSRGTSAASGEMPVALRVVEEAPVKGSDDSLPEVVEEPSVGLPSSSSPTPLAGAASFDDAPDLDPGATVSDAVAEGDEHLYRVRLDWGQALAVRVDVAAQDLGAEEVLGGSLPAVNLTLFDPLRNSFDTGHDDADADGSYSDEATTLFDGTREVAFANRFDDALMSVPGDYWVSVAVAPPSSEREAVEVPVELTVSVTGSGDSAPPFQEVVLAPSTGAGPEDYDPSTPYLVDDGVFSADVSGTPRVPGDDDAAESSVRRVAGLAVGGASLVCLLAGVVLLRRRVRRPAAR